MFKKIQSKLQTFAGAMMVPIILLVLVGFYVGIGSAVTNYILPEGSFISLIFQMFTNLGFMFMNNLQIWFAIGIAFSLAKKEKGWAAFAGVVLYMSYIKGIEGIAGFNGWTQATTAIEALVSSGYTQEAALNFNALWGSHLGIFNYNMGIFSGLIAGLSAAWIHNKFVDTELPSMFSFFGGTKFVIIMVTVLSVPLAAVTYVVWPYVASALASVTRFISGSGLLGTFVFGTLDKLLLPFGIHHLIAFPIEYSAVGGTMVIDGVLYEGVRNIIVGQAGSASATGYITRNFTTGRILFQLAGLPGAAFAMYKLSKSENKRKVASLLVPAVLTLALVGVSEPIEYTFLFLAPQLYFLVYAPLTGLMYVLAEVFKISINGHALLFMIPNLLQPHKVHAMSLIFLLPLAFVLYYVIFKFFIKKWDLNTPGRKDDEAKLMSKKEYQALKEEASKDATFETEIVTALGGADNIVSVTNCATRLRVEVKDGSQVASDALWTDHLDASGVVRADNHFQIIYGPRVVNIATRVKDILGHD